ncbi:MAG: dihydropteroate synthase [Pseudomonadota bacterium]|jgi:dihydropteroate synthase
MSRPQVWGIVNVTPDSFSDGGRYASLEAALEHARRLIAEGADVLDIGGESTRPGAEPVSLEGELARVIPLIEALRRETSTPISIDTLKPEAARAAIAAGASIWNDVTALRGAGDSLATAATLGCEVVLMHMQGEPRTMQAAPHYDDVTAEVINFLMERADAALAAGVARERIWLDPGIGFGKSLAHNLTLLQRLPEIVALGFPVLLGASRKRFIAGLDPSAASAEDRLGGSLGAALRGAEAGCAAVRVHDALETRQALEVWAAIRDA